MPSYVVQCSYMPGDTFGVSAALALTPDLKLILIVDSKLADNKHADIMGFYRETGQADQIVQIDISTTKGQAKDVWRDFFQNELHGTVPRQIAWDPVRIAGETREQVKESVLSRLYFDLGNRAWPHPVTWVTERVAAAFNSDADDALRKVAAQWKQAEATGSLKDELDAYIRSKGLEIVKPEKIVVLWSRQSGKRGGAHIELDSSYSGIKQLANLLCVNAKIILAGDDKLVGDDQKKLGEIANGLPNTVSVAEMWKDELWRPIKDKGLNRLGQVMFFKRLQEKVHGRLVHVGMRSGNLEALALSGMKTFFLEPESCPTGDRMLVFGENGIPYQRIQIKKSPGLTARWGEEFVNRPDQKFPASKATLEEAVGIQITGQLQKKPGVYEVPTLPGVTKLYTQKEMKALRAANGGGNGDWDIAKDAARKTVKGLPFTVPDIDSDADNPPPIKNYKLPAFDDDGHIYMRGFGMDDLHKIAVMIVRSLST